MKPYIQNNNSFNSTYYTQKSTSVPSLDKIIYSQNPLCNAYSRKKFKQDLVSGDFKLQPNLEQSNHMSRTRLPSTEFNTTQSDKFFSSQNQQKQQKQSQKMLSQYLSPLSTNKSKHFYLQNNQKESSQCSIQQELSQIIDHNYRQQKQKKIVQNDDNFSPQKYQSQQTQEDEKLSSLLSPLKNSPQEQIDKSFNSKQFSHQILGNNNHTNSYTDNNINNNNITNQSEDNNNNIQLNKTNIQQRKLPTFTLDTKKKYAKQYYNQKHSLCLESKLNKLTKSIQDSQDFQKQQLILQSQKLNSIIRESKIQNQQQQLQQQNQGQNHSKKLNATLSPKNHHKQFPIESYLIDLQRKRDYQKDNEYQWQQCFENISLNIKQPQQQSDTLQFGRIKQIDSLMSNKEWKKQQKQKLQQKVEKQQKSALNSRPISPPHYMQPIHCHQSHHPSQEQSKQQTQINSSRKLNQNSSPQHIQQQQQQQQKLKIDIIMDESEPTIMESKQISQQNTPKTKVKFSSPQSDFDCSTTHNKQQKPTIKILTTQEDSPFKINNNNNSNSNKNLTLDLQNAAQMMSGLQTTKSSKNKVQLPNFFPSSNTPQSNQKKSQQKSAIKPHAQKNMSRFSQFMYMQNAMENNFNNINSSKKPSNHLQKYKHNSSNNNSSMQSSTLDKSTSHNNNMGKSTNIMQQSLIRKIHQKNGIYITTNEQNQSGQNSIKNTHTQTKKLQSQNNLMKNFEYLLSQLSENFQQLYQLNLSKKTLYSMVKNLLKSKNYMTEPFLDHNKKKLRPPCLPEDLKFYFIYPKTLAYVQDKWCRYLLLYKTFPNQDKKLEYIQQVKKSFNLQFALQFIYIPDIQMFNKLLEEYLLHKHEDQLDSIAQSIIQTENHIIQQEKEFLKNYMQSSFIDVATELEQIQYQQGQLFYRIIQNKKKGHQLGQMENKYGEFKHIENKQRFESQQIEQCIDNLKKIQQEKIDQKPFQKKKNNYDYKI